MSSFELLAANALDKKYMWYKSSACIDANKISLSHLFPCI